MAGDAKVGDGSMDETLPADSKQTPAGEADAGSFDDTAYADGPPPAPAAAEPSEDPANIGRYVVIRRIGAGGMGLIYAAYDAELDRKVAVKLLRPGGHLPASAAKARMQREAQSLAKLSHPSVIHVYEVGTFGDEVFIAMEFVEGVTLGKWQASLATWRDILGPYLDAGRGLAAAHEAGIVHRDFKPDNVLVRKDGRVRVLDFGLARTEVAGDEDLGDAVAVIETDQTIADMNREALVLTQTGAVLGTPAYMAPEQHRGQATDARTDQFSYCVSLWEALYGTRPFTGDTLAQLTHNVLDGNLEQPSKYIKVPGRLRQVLLRGLSVDPAERFGSMNELLTELARDPGIVMRRLAIGAGALALATAIGYTWWASLEARREQGELDQIAAQLGGLATVPAFVERRGSAGDAARQAWTSMVLARAQELLEVDPTGAIAALKQLPVSDDSWVQRAREIGSGAIQRGVIAHTIDVPGGGPISAVAVSPTRDELAIALGSGDAVLWPLEAPTTTPLGEPPRTGTTDVAWSPDGESIALAADDGTIRVLSRAGHPVATLDGHRAAVTAIDFAPEGLIVASAGADGQVLIWDVEAGTHDDPRMHGGPVRDVEFSPDGKRLATAADDGCRLWRLDERKHVKLRVDAPGDTAQFGPRDRGLLTRHADNSLWVWSASSGEGYRWETFGSTSAMAVDRATGTVVAAGIDGGIILGEDSGRRSLPVAGAPRLVAADRGLAVGVFGDRLIRVWETRRDTGTVVELPQKATALAFSPDGTSLAAGGLRGALGILDVTTRAYRTLGDTAGRVTSIAYAPDGAHLSAVTDDVSFAIWNVASGTRTGSGPKSKDYPIHWSNRGDRLVAVDCYTPVECSARIYDLSGNPLVSVDGLIRDVVFSLDDRFALFQASALLGGVILLDVERRERRPISWTGGEDVTQLLGVAPVESGAFRILAWDGVWQLDPERGHARRVVPTRDFDDVHQLDSSTVILRTEDGRAALWEVAADTMLPLPALPIDDDTRLSPDRTELLVRDARDGASSWQLVHVRTGQGRSVPPLSEPIAWSRTGMIADTTRTGVRLSLHTIPTDAKAFSHWLDRVSDHEVTRSELVEGLTLDRN